jgi:hypothetical protein
VVDQDLAEPPLGTALLLGQRALELLVGHEALLHQERAERLPAREGDLNRRAGRRRR